METQNYRLCFNFVMYACLLAQIRSIAPCLSQGSQELGSQQDTAINESISQWLTEQENKNMVCMQLQMLLILNSAFLEATRWSHI